jgi:outer membrane receptor protein involved in Fe transport
MKSRRAALAVSVLSILLVVNAPVHAQRTEGTIAGTVSDPAGAAIPGAKITVISQETALTREVATNDIGYYRVSFLPPGRYAVRAEALGFKTTVLTDIEVNVNVVTRADVELSVGALAETVEVSGGAALVQVEQARLADTFDNRQVEELPLNGREVYQLLTLQPGVVSAQAPTISNVPSPNSPGTFDFTFVSNGATPRGNNFVLDGTTNNNEWLGGTPLIFPSVDAIQEFQVQTLNFSAEYGRNNGAVANIVTKSGTNDPRGRVFYFHRNTAVNARNPFDPADEKAPLLQHQFGASTGGPVRRDRTFFFVNYEGSRRKDGAPELATAETPEFRGLVQATGPRSLAAQFFNDFPAPGCVPGTQRDVGSIPAPGTLFGRGPADGIPDYCDVIAAQVQKHRVDQYMGRFDGNVGGQDKLFVRWIGSDAPTDVSRQQLLNANMRGFRSPLDGFYADLGTGYTHFFSNTLLNDFRFAWARNDTEISFELPPSTTTAQALGGSNRFGHLSLSDGVVPFGGVIFIPRTFVFDTFTVADTLAQVVGRHALKYGFEWRHIREKSDYQFETMPFYLFNNIFTFANDDPWLAEALVNRDPSSPAFGQFTGTPRNFRWNQWAVFVQDDWQLGPNLTLNLGLRYEVFGLPYEADGLLANIILGPGNDIFDRIAGARAGRVETLGETDYNNVAPRLGVAWDPFGNGTTVLRSGLSVAYLEPYSNLYTNVTRFLPPDAAWVDSFPVFGVGRDVNYTFPFQPSPDFAAPATANGAVRGSGLFPPGLNPELETAYSRQWFVGLQHEFLKGWAFSVNYVGTQGEKLYIREDWNRVTGDICSAAACDFREDRLAPGWFQMFYVDNGTNSTYHGMNAQVRKASSRGLMFTANYTLGKSEDTVSGPGLGDYFNVSNARYTGTQDVRDREADRGPSEFDVRQRFTLTALWNLPSPDGNGLMEKLLGGWQLNTIVSLQTGRPFSVFCSLAWFEGCDFNMDGTEFDRPNRPANLQTSGWSSSEFRKGIFGADRAESVRVFCPNGLTPFFNGTPCVPVGTNGNLGRNVFRGPAFASVDVAIFKNTTVGQARLQFRAEIFNLLNRVNLFLPVGNLGSPNFGRSLAAFPSRQIQFGLKWFF